METTVRHHMTPAPQSIQREAPLGVATAMMNELRIRHLPVLHGGKLVGVLSQRDITLVESLRNLGLDDITVEDAISANPYSVGPNERLSVVVRHMAERKLGSAVVVDGEVVVGIFTAIDAFRVLAELLDA